MKKPLLVLGVIAAGAFAAKLWTGAEPQLVLGRIWVDHLPKNDKDTINAFAALTREPVGVFQATSQWKGTYELFMYESSGGEMRIVFPQTGQKEKIRARAWKCNEAGMDYCLELAGASRGVARYRSRKGWELEAASAEQARARIESIAGSASADPPR